MLLTNKKGGIYMKKEENKVDFDLLKDIYKLDEETLLKRYYTYAKEEVRITEDLFDDLTDIFIMADIGVETTLDFIEELSEYDELVDEKEVVEEKEESSGSFDFDESPPEPSPLPGGCIISSGKSSLEPPDPLPPPCIAFLIASIAAW